MALSAAAVQVMRLFEEHKMPEHVVSLAKTAISMARNDRSIVVSSTPSARHT